MKLLVKFNKQKMVIHKVQEQTHIEWPEKNSNKMVTMLMVDLMEMVAKRYYEKLFFILVYLFEEKFHFYNQFKTYTRIYIVWRIHHYSLLYTASYFGGSFLNVLILLIKALANWSVSKCFLTGSISSLRILATAGLRSLGCNNPSSKSLANYSYEL